MFVLLEWIFWNGFKGSIIFENFVMNLCSEKTEVSRIPGNNLHSQVMFFGEGQQ